jgi:hypothetical protein
MTTQTLSSLSSTPPSRVFSTQTDGYSLPPFNVISKAVGIEIETAIQKKEKVTIILDYELVV